MSKHFPTKDLVPNLLHSNIVYNVNCLNCDSMYISKTIRQSIRRLQEHGANIIIKRREKSKPLEKTNNSNNHGRSDRNKGKHKTYFPGSKSATADKKVITPSGIKKHEINTNYTIKWSSFNIITKDYRRYHLLVKESLLVSIHQPNLNKTVCSV